MNRERVISFRLVSPNNGNGLQLRLNESEFKAVERAAHGELVATFVRELVIASLPSQPWEHRHALERLQARAAALHMPIGEYVRLVVLEGVGYTALREDFARARLHLSELGK